MGIGQQPVVRRILKWDAGVKHGADVKPVEDLHQAGDMVLVWMAQDEKVDAAREKRKVRAKATEGQLRVRTAVDQHGRTGRGLDQDRVALADIERSHVQPSVRAGRGGDREQDGHQGKRHRHRTEEPACQRGSGAGGAFVR